MNFDELPLISAINKIRESLRVMSSEDTTKSVSSSYWERGDGALELTQMIAQEMVTEVNEYWITAFIRYRKQPNVDSVEKTKKADIKAELFRSGQKTCFYANRGLGDCCDEVELDRILPGSAGGKYTVANCVISCKTHNGMRSDMPFTDFLNQTFSSEADQ